MNDDFDLKEQIEKHGWAGIGVFPDEGSENEYPFTYTVGFTGLDHPEVIVGGLPPSLAHSLLWTVYEKIVSGQTFEDGDESDEIIENFTVRFKSLPPDGCPANAARAYYEREELPVLQMVWPDAEGFFPDDARCNPKYAVAQDIEIMRD